MAINPLAIGGGVVAAAAVVGGGLYAGGVFSGGDSSGTQHNPNRTPQKAVLTVTDYLDAKAEGYAGKWGETYANYLVNSKKNDKWWGESYAKFKEEHTKTPKTDKFKDVSSANTLKATCDAAYKADKTGAIDTANTDTTGNKYKESEIWKYCSPLGQKPSTLSSKDTEKNQYNSKIGADTNKSQKLVSTEDANNTEFWKVRQEHFFSDAGQPASTDLFFKDLYDTKKTSIVPDLLKNKCKDAYGKDTGTGASSKENPTPDEVVKYCSLTGKTTD